jgi:hypothetical protein
MELKDEEFQTLQLRVNQISSELDKRHAIGAVNTKWMLIVGAVILAALGYTSIFQLPKEAAKAAIEKIGPEVIEKADKTMANLRNCDVEAKGILDRLRDSSANTIPPDTLAFFNCEDCPEGWEEFKEGSGRFLIAKGSGYPFGTKGGKKMVSLSLKQMPSHDHLIPIYKHGKMKPPKFPLTYQAVQAGDKRGNYITQLPEHLTKKSGEGEPHENMPPFLALTLCRKQ